MFSEKSLSKCQLCKVLHLQTLLSAEWPTTTNCFHGWKNSHCCPPLPKHVHIKYIVLAKIVAGHLWSQSTDIRLPLHTAACVAMVAVCMLHVVSCIVRIPKLW